MDISEYGKTDEFKDECGNTIDFSEYSDISFTEAFTGHTSCSTDPDTKKNQVTKMPMPVPDSYIPYYKDNLNSGSNKIPRTNVNKEKTILNERMDISGEDMEKALNDIVANSRKTYSKELEKYGFEIYIGSQSDKNFWKNL